MTLGKTWLACALPQHACRQGRSALYLRVPRLAEELRILHGLPIEHWHAWLGDPTVADAILDRLMQRCRRFNLEGESRRTGQAARAAAKRQKPLKEDAQIT